MKMERRQIALFALSFGLLAVLTTLVLIGLTIPVHWTTQIWAGGFINDKVTLTPFPPLSEVEVFPLQDAPATLEKHYYLLGSDAGGRDLFALVARGSLPSLELVGLALLLRLVIGLIAGLAIAGGFAPLRVVARAAGGWIAGFPYLALAILVIQAFTGGPSAIPQPGLIRLIGFTVAIAVVGWRDIAQVVAGRIQWVEAQPFALGARAVGSGGWGLFARHVWPYLRPALMVELSFQASAVLVLLAELGFLQYYLGGSTAVSEDTQGVAAFNLANQPELGQLLSDIRLYELRHEYAPVLVPAVALALAALAFELLGRALRGRSDLPQ
jgi:ABC-type dipeptide/oligopeptide/nickel transport system permease subunit